jgi:16S rRNA (cytidine1402-2'-O)-methyltransferase
MTLILLPNTLGEEMPEGLMPPALAEATARLDGLIAESDRAGRRFLSRYPTKRPAREIPIALFDDPPEFLLEPVMAGETWGVISDAGLPCLADPGSRLVRRARERGLAIEAVPGPSAILLALMLSGLSGQHFNFIGYLKREREEHIRQLEKAEGTQLFIEAPYRNQYTLEALVETLSADTLLSIACDLTLPTELVITKPVVMWRSSPLPDIHKRPTVFLIASGKKARVSPSKPPRQQRGGGGRRGRA